MLRVRPQGKTAMHCCPVATLGALFAMTYPGVSHATTIPPTGAQRATQMNLDVAAKGNAVPVAHGSAAQ